MVDLRYKDSAVKIKFILLVLGFYWIAQSSLVYSFDPAKCKESRVYFIPDSLGLGLFTTSSQTTSSWGGCSLLGIREQREVFIATNTDNIMIDSARGGGEYLDALAELSGCSGSTARKQFCIIMQMNFEQIYLSKIALAEVNENQINENKSGINNALFFNNKSDQITQANTEQVPSKIDTLISSDPVLSKNCVIEKNSLQASKGGS